MRIHNHTTIKLASGYLLSLLLIPIYVSLFPLWQLVSATFPASALNLLPAVLVAVLLLVPVLLPHTSMPTGARLLPILAGIGLCCLALAIPDARLPAKRVHVAEYLLLSLVVRFAMSQRLRGVPLLVCATGFTIILGVHDEFLQGFHPLRTYGISDMTVNALAGCGGGLIWHALLLFDAPAMHTDTDRAKGPPLVLFYLLWLLAAVLALTAPAASYHGGPIPLWTVAPLLGAAIGCRLWRPRFPAHWRHGIIALGCISLPLSCYPLLTYAGTLLFY